MSLIVFAFTSCLDVEPVNLYAEDDVWASVRNVDANVKSFYANVLNNGYVCQLREQGGLSEGYTDLVKFTRYSGNNFNKLFAEANFLKPESAGGFSPYNTMYSEIAKANYFLIQINEGKGNALNKKELETRIGEVRFLRAFAYQELVKRHGGVILRISETKLDGIKDQKKARSSANECWDFIIAEYRKATDLLPESWDAANNGRLTKGAAWGMMARAALYANKWDVAIEASEEVLKLKDAGHYMLMNDYADIFAKPHNKELILAVYFNREEGLQHNWDKNFAPSGDAEKYVGGLASPTDEFASSFDIKIGDNWKAFNWDEVTKDKIDPWKNRDPRFYQTILYNDAEWRGRRLQLYPEGRDGFMHYAESGMDDAYKSVTGYVIRKFLSTKEMDYGQIQSDQHWVEMRLAEIYLILSEAYAQKGAFNDAYANLNIIRTTRASVKLPELPTKTNWEDYFKDLQKERICELGLEGHRYFDILRWRIGGEVLKGKKTHGVKVTKEGEGKFTYERIECDVRDRIFPDKYHVIPIPYAEITSNTLCVQDDIWK